MKVTTPFCLGCLILAGLTACVGQNPDLPNAAQAQDSRVEQSAEQDPAGKASQGSQKKEQSQDDQTQSADKSSEAERRSKDPQQSAKQSGEHRGSGDSQEAEKLRSTFSSLKQQIEEAEKTLQELTTQRNKAQFEHEMTLKVTQLETKIEDLREQNQREIEELQQKIQQRKEQLSQVEQKHEQFNQALGQLESSGGDERWRDVRQEIQTAWSELQSAYSDADQMIGKPGVASSDRGGSQQR